MLAWDYNIYYPAVQPMDESGGFTLTGLMKEVYMDGVDQGDVHEPD